MLSFVSTPLAINRSDAVCDFLLEIGRTFLSYPSIGRDCSWIIRIWRILWVHLEEMHKIWLNMKYCFFFASYYYYSNVPFIWSGPGFHMMYLLISKTHMGEENNIYVCRCVHVIVSIESDDKRRCHWHILTSSMCWEMQCVCVSINTIPEPLSRYSSSCCHRISARSTLSI